MNNLPVGVSSFEKLIRGNFLYVDKTKLIYDLFADGGQYFFLSRPRRFGKSLLVSTLKEIFSGNKELFRGLWIYDKIQWEEHPVIHIDFLGLTYGNPKELTDTLEYLLDENARRHGIKLNERTYDKKFQELIRKLADRNKVVILVDEYDKPIINVLENPEIATENRNILRSFYENIKAADEYIRFAFLTGVSKFSKVSVFSGLNNLRDITLSHQFSTLLGYTETELREYFDDRLEQLTPSFKKNKKTILEDVKRWYNGYSWDGENFVYNPFSILSFFQEKRFRNYWFSTGTPTLLINLIREKKVNLTRIDVWEEDEYVFDSYDVDRQDVASLLFQTGYITIKGIKEIGENRKYYLTFPNKEVKDSFLKYLLADLTETSAGDIGGRLFKLVEFLLNNEPGQFFETFKSIFAGIPYNVFIADREAFYHAVVYLVLNLLGVSVSCEVQTNTGRIDAVVEVGERIFIMEFKLGTAQEALAQVKEKKYHEKYSNTGKEVVLIGIGFDMEQRNIGDYIIETQ